MVDLAQMRKEKGLTQEQLARSCGVVRQCISNIECGQHKPSVSLAKRIARILKFDWTKFFEEGE